MCRFIGWCYLLDCEGILVILESVGVDFLEIFVSYK